MAAIAAAAASRAIRVAVIVGSLRSASNNLGVAKAFVSAASKLGIESDLIVPGDIPLFNA